jgi:hypothetical protein
LPHWYAKGIAPECLGEFVPGLKSKLQAVPAASVVARKYANAPPDVLPRGPLHLFVQLPDPMQEANVAVILDGLLRWHVFRSLDDLRADCAADMFAAGEEAYEKLLGLDSLLKETDGEGTTELLELIRNAWLEAKTSKSG